MSPRVRRGARICLVSCSASKNPTPAPAKDLYTSALFRAARSYAESHFDRWYILSAKHHLLDPDQQVAPYDMTLDRMGVKERHNWARTVLKALLRVTEAGDTITFLAGNRYREGFVEPLRREGRKVEVPMEGLRIGEQLQWLNARLAGRSDDRRLADLDRFYELLDELEQRLGGRRRLGDCDGKMLWPRRGVYFFFEPGELRDDGSTARVVRVGTHAVSSGAKATLWGRLRAHRGHKDGGGNHRGSIFRLHVGAALLARDGRESEFPQWGVGSAASGEVRDLERPAERLVSEYLGRMSLLWLAIEDEPGPQSDRAYIERNAIGLLAGPDGPMDRPSGEWLGRCSVRDAIRSGGLWNLNHVEGQYEPEFLDRLADYCLPVQGDGPRKNIPAGPDRKGE